MMLHFTSLLLFIVKSFHVFIFARIQLHTRGWGRTISDHLVIVTTFVFFSIFALMSLIPRIRLSALSTAISQSSIRFYAILSWHELSPFSNAISKLLTRLDFLLFEAHVRSIINLMNVLHMDGIMERLMDTKLDRLTCGGLIDIILTKVESYHYARTHQLVSIPE